MRNRLICLLALFSSAWTGNVALAQAPAPEAEAPLTPAEVALIRGAEEARVRAIDSVYGAVVAIYGNDRGGGGSGVLYDESGLALTNHHVVGGAGTEGWAGLADGKLYRWRLVGTDPGGDVAIIQLLGKDKFPLAPLGNSDLVRVGDFAMAMGNPFVLAEDQRPTVTLGIVSGIERFQEGSGNNQLVYGNCIQIDSSINPGNSGGPLFNQAGEVIGINGRGSFKERGRVNVGLGYAISINQIKHFLPDLLATKMVQHGTLDAVFGNRMAGGVVCHTLNLDAPIAKLGMQLGDKLVAFEGHPIKSANQFNNLISTLPAGWPCEVTFEHEGKQTTVHVRLTDLPYGPKQEPMEDPKPMPTPEKPKDPPAGEKKEPEKPATPSDEKKPDAEKKPDEEKKPADEKKPAEEKKPETPPLPRPAQPMMRQPPNFGQAGEIRDAAQNEENAKRIVSRWRTLSVAEQAQAAAGWIGVDEIRRGDAAVGKQTLSIARDGRFRVEVEVDGKTSRFGHDGKEFWSQPAGEAAAVVDAERVCRNPFGAQGYILATLLGESPLASIGKVTIDGGDKAQGKIAYRLKAVDAQTDEFFVWLSVMNAGGKPEVQLLKTGESFDDERTAAVVYEDWKAVGPLQWPHQRRVVNGLGEKVALAIAAKNVEAQSSFDDGIFKKPSDEKK